MSVRQYFNAHSNVESGYCYLGKFISVSLRERNHTLDNRQLTLKCVAMSYGADGRAHLVGKGH